MSMQITLIKVIIACRGHLKHSNKLNQGRATLGLPYSPCTMP